MKFFLMTLLILLQGLALWKIGILRVTMIAVFLGVLSLAALLAPDFLGRWPDSRRISPSPLWLFNVVGWILLAGMTALLLSLAWGRLL